MSKKLLLADDSITIQKVIGITFVNEDYELTVVDNGVAALEKARELHPDLILADVFMPGKNGYELCSAVKQDPVLGTIPVLLLAGTFEPFDEDKATAAGADGWIAKPFESQALIDRVEELLARAVAQPAPASTPAAEPVSVAAAAGAVKSDLWEEIEEQVPTPAVPAEPEEAGIEWDEAFAPEEAAEEDADDIWSEVTFEEEDLLEEVPEPVAADGAEAVATSPAPLVEASLEEAFAPETEEVDDFLFEEEPLEAEESAAAEEDSFIFEEEAAEAVDGPEEEEAFIFEDEAEADEDVLAATEMAAVSGGGEEEILEEEDILLLDDEDILPLEDEDILEEEDLEPGGELPAQEPAGSEGAEFSDFDEEAVFSGEEDFAMDEELLSGELETPAVLEEPAASEEPLVDAEEPVTFEEPLVEAEEPAASEEPLVETEEPVAFEEPLVETEEPVAFEEPLVEAEELTELIEEGPEWARTEPEEEIAAASVAATLAAGMAAPAAFAAVEPAPEPAAAVAPVAAAEEKVRALSEEELTEIVERVAGSVIERLAGTILEKIAWEVVPDLAENMIKEEIRKIKEMASQT